MPPKSVCSDKARLFSMDLRLFAFINNFSKLPFTTRDVRGCHNFLELPFTFINNFLKLPFTPRDVRGCNNFSELPFTP